MVCGMRSMINWCRFVGGDGRREEDEVNGLNF